MVAKTKLTRKMAACRSEDASRLPYGDLMGDDKALDNFRSIRKEMYSIRCATPRLKKRHMGKKEFKEFLEHAGDIGDDEPLSKYI